MYDIGTYADIAEGATSILFECLTPATLPLGLLEGGSFDAGTSHSIRSLLALKISIYCFHVLISHLPILFLSQQWAFHRSSPWIVILS